MSLGSTPRRFARAAALAALLLTMLTGCGFIESTPDRLDPLRQTARNLGTKPRLVEQQSGPFGTMILYDFGDPTLCGVGRLYLTPQGQRLSESSGIGHCPGLEPVEGFSGTQGQEQGQKGTYYVGTIGDPRITSITLVTADKQAHAAKVQGRVWYAFVADGGTGKPSAWKVIGQNGTGAVASTYRYGYTPQGNARDPMEHAEWVLDVQPQEVAREKGPFGDLALFTYQQNGQCGYGYILAHGNESGGQTGQLQSCASLHVVPELLGQTLLHGWFLAYGRVNGPEVAQVLVVLQSGRQLKATVPGGLWYVWAEEPDSRQAQVQTVVGLDADGRVLVEQVTSTSGAVATPGS